MAGDGAAGVRLFFSYLGDPGQWILAPEHLLSAGFVVVLRGGPKGSCIATVSGALYPLEKKANSPLCYLGGYIVKQGVFVVASKHAPGFEGPYVKLMVDSGAEECCAPADDAALLSPTTRRAPRLLMADNSEAPRLGCGALLVCFPREADGQAAYLHRLLPTYCGQLDESDLKAISKVRRTSRRACDMHPEDGGVDPSFDDGEGQSGAANAQGVWGVLGSRRRGRRVGAIQRLHAGGAGSGAGGGPKAGAREPGFPPIATAQLLHERYNVVSAKDFSYLLSGRLGVKGGIPPPTGNVASPEYYEAASTRRPVPHKAKGGRQRAVEARRQMKCGDRVSIDISHKFGQDPDGNSYCLSCTDVKTDFVKLYFMKTKTAAEVILNLQRLKQYVAKTVRGGNLHVFLGDNDAAWAVTGSGETSTTAAVTKWLAEHDAAEAAGFSFAAPYTHQHVDVERSMFRLYAFMNVNLHRARFAAKLWSDALRAAAWQVNALPSMRNRDLDGPRRKSRYEHYHGEEPDLSRMVGYFGQTVYKHIEGKKVNGGEPNAVPGYLVCPHAEGSGWLIRTWHDRRCGACYHFRVVNDKDAFAVRLLASDTLLAGGGGHLNADAKLLRSQLRSLFETNPQASLGSFAVVDPLTGIPVRLEMGRVKGDDDEVIMVPALLGMSDADSGVLPSLAAAGATLTAASAAAQAPAAEALPEPVGLPLVWDPASVALMPVAAAEQRARAFLVTLPDDQPVSFVKDAKTGATASRQRYEAYSRASTYGEYLTLAAGLTGAKRDSAGVRRDFVNDLARGHVRVCAAVVASGAGLGGKAPASGALAVAGGAIATPLATSGGIHGGDSPWAGAEGPGGGGGSRGGGGWGEGGGHGAGVQTCDLCLIAVSVQIWLDHVGSRRHRLAVDGVAGVTRRFGAIAAAAVTAAVGCDLCGIATFSSGCLRYQHALSRAHGDVVAAMAAATSSEAVAVGTLGMAAAEPAALTRGGGGGAKPAAPASGKGSGKGAAASAVRGGGAKPAAPASGKGANKGAAASAASGGGAKPAAPTSGKGADKGAAASAASGGGAKPAAPASGKGSGKGAASAASGGGAKPAAVTPSGGDSGVRMYVRMTLGDAEEALLEKMAVECPAILREHFAAGRKASQWPLWVFPAAVRGHSGQGPLSGIDPEAAALFLQSVPTVWRAVLEKIEALVRVGGLGAVFPTQDHHRIRSFVHLWSAEPTCPGWLWRVMKTLCPAELRRRQASHGSVAAVASVATDDARAGCPAAVGARPCTHTGVWDCWRCFDARAVYEARVVAVESASVPDVAPGAWDVEREASIAATDNHFAAGVAFEALEEVNPYPYPAGDRDLVDWVLERAYHERRVGALLAAPNPVPGLPTEYKSIPSAMKDPRWGTPSSGGLCEAASGEIVRVFEKFRAGRLISEVEHAALRRTYGARVEERRLVILFSEKRSATTAAFTRHKMRVALADLVCLGKVLDKFSATVAMGTVRFVANLTAGLKGRLYTLDVAGAYLHGSPLRPEDGGRVILVRVPPGFEQFGYPERDASGRPNYFLVTGNVPGRQDAGLIWQICNDEFLRSFGFTQSSVDRRCFIFRRDGELMIICIWVDDSFIWCSDDSLWAEFYEAWSVRFPPSEEGVKGAVASEAKVCELEFCGLTIATAADGCLEITCGKLVADLEVKLSLHGPHEVHAKPLKDTAIQVLREPPTVADPLIEDKVQQTEAMSILGLGGFIAQACRADLCLGFIAIAQQVSANFKRSTWRTLLRWAHYAVCTAAAYALRFTPPDDRGAWCGSSDASCINANDEEGVLAGSFMGWGVHFSGSGFLDYGCGVTRRLGLATAHTELRALVVVAKVVVALRIMAREFGFPPTGPTRIFGDAKAAFEGSLLDKIPRKERFMAAMKAMVRLWVRDGLIVFVRVPSLVLRPDIFSKSNFTDLAFGRLAHWVQRGQPRDDDGERLAAVLHLEAPVASVVKVRRVHSIHAGITDLWWESPFSEEACASRALAHQLEPAEPMMAAAAVEALRRGWQRELREARREVRSVGRAHSVHFAEMKASHRVELSRAVGAASEAAVDQERVRAAGEVRAEAVAAVAAERAAATQRGIDRKKAQRMRS